MLSKSTTEYKRPHARQLLERLLEPRRFMQVLAGPRQVGKTTVVRQVGLTIGLPFLYTSADEPGLKGAGWIAQQWETARAFCRQPDTNSAVLALDEIQKINGWSETVKRLWDEDSASGIALKVVILGSAPLLMKQGLSESLAGRFEILHLRHWSFNEMHDAFGWDVDTYIKFGGYPGSASLIGAPDRWTRYVLDSLVETTISRDVLLMTRVDKPALLRQLFELGCRYSGQILSYTKMLGQLQDAGNTTTLAHYLELLSAAGMVTGIQKFAGDAARRRASSPKLQVLNNALMTVTTGSSAENSGSATRLRGRLVESAVGAHLANEALTGSFELFYWREGDLEVDFILRKQDRLTAIEVKSGTIEDKLHRGTEAFRVQFSPQRCLLVGSGGIPLEDFLSQPADTWV